MSAPTEKIRAGLDAHERAKASGSIPYSNLIEVPRTTSEVSNLAARAKTLRDRFKAITEGVNSHLAKYRAETEARFADFGKTKDENGVIRDSVGDTQRRKAIEDDVAAHRRDVLKISADDRASILAEIREINRKLTSVADMHNDAVSILMTGTLGSKRRGEFAHDLEHSGPREIELAVKRALVHGDRDLLAACFSRLDSLDKRTRELVNVSKADAAQHIVTDQLQLGRQSLALAEVSLDHAMILEDEVNGKRIASQRKIGLGVKKADLRKLGIDIDSESAPLARSASDGDGKDKPAKPAHSDVKPEPKPEIDTSKYKISDAEWEQMLEAARADA